MLLSSLLSVLDVVPDAEIYIHFTEDEFDLPPVIRYNKVELSAEQKAWVKQYPQMQRNDGRTAPRTTFFKIPALYSLPGDVDDVLYLDIDTVLVSDPSSIFDEMGDASYIAAALSLGSLKDRQPFNAGVMAFRRHNLPPGFDKTYHEAVIASQGYYGDQEVFSRIKVQHYNVSPVYNSRRLLKGTKILHVSGRKPFESYPDLLSLKDQDYTNRCNEIMANYKSSHQRLQLGKGNPEGAFYYLEYFRRAMYWVESVDPYFNKKAFLAKLHKNGCSCCN